MEDRLKVWRKGKRCGGRQARVEEGSRREGLLEGEGEKYKVWRKIKRFEER